ncbi:sterile alpha motif domain-containing protein 9-like [Stegostoma tigrinum]|uniref:sterile alpha motif domain-containing protein 9-like n=1 Tax=Stegostoma tigrinum TaxID=3053191 RepID=UPI00202AE14B|nr:sterile alpha motif domain-containing protein 9-like [Stegostoma tigrinum]XP_048377379.1 sterile alpha motif domain-containing protein 9-like [Stegostoma tigrinum]
MSGLCDLPDNLAEWTKMHVRDWVVGHLKLDQKYGDILYNEDVNGVVLKELTKGDIRELGIKAGPAAVIIRKRDEFIKGSKSEAKLATCANDKQICSERSSSSEVNDSDCKVVASNESECQSTKPDSTEVAENSLQEKHNVKKRRGKTEPDSCTINCQVDTEIQVTLATSTKPEEDEIKEQECSQQTSAKIQRAAKSKLSCEPYPFDERHVGTRYIQNYILSPETGPSNLIDPVHEFKLFNLTVDATEEDMKKKFSNEVFRFAAACMNSRTNGTIHFGVGDTGSGYEHGEIIGVSVDNPAKYIDHISNHFAQYFEKEKIEHAKLSIRPPRFVEILNPNQTLSAKFIIEVDVVPSFRICDSNLYHIYMMNQVNGKWMKSKEQHLFIRDGGSSRDILRNKNLTEREAEYRRFSTETLKTLVDKRKSAEEKPQKQTKQQEGYKLVRMITGGSEMIDTSYYQWYILVTNKSQQTQAHNFDFVKEMNWFCVLEFDPESVTSGVCKSYREDRATNLHFPSHFQDIDTAVTEKIEQLHLYKQTSWIFCNGRSDLDDQNYKPLVPKMWYKERAADVRKLISFLCRVDIMPKGKFLVVFLILSKVDDPRDPFLETFCSFFQELKGTEDILCICESHQTFLRWKDLMLCTCESYELTERCVSALSLEEVNATVLKLKSVTRSTRRFLPSATSASVILQKKDEELLTALEILCENECEGTEIENDQNRFKEFQKSKEEQFYRGGKASWWNFYFDTKVPFIKRDSYMKLEELINAKSPSAMCVKIINLFHHPGCGGTTLAMHFLWESRKKFRCAVLKNSKEDFVEIGKQVIHLVTYQVTTNSEYLPVLLLVDDFEELENVHVLQNLIQAIVAEKGLRFEWPLVIILNCMRSQDPVKSSKKSVLESVALKHELSIKEQQLFERKLEEIEEQHSKPENFYSFMIMKSNFDEKYIENVVHNSLKDLNTKSKQGQLISILALLNWYVKDSSISVSKCEEFLGLGQVKTSFWGPEKFEDAMGTYCNLLIRVEVEEFGRYEGIRIIHPLIANRCLDELKHSYKLHKSEIALMLLSQSIFLQRSIGREKLLQDTWSLLITRRRKEHGDEADTLFSPLIEALQSEEGNKQVVNVLTEASNRFDQNPFISQVLARHFYLIVKDYDSALYWATKAKERAKDNSYITDTLGQVFKSKLKYRMECVEIDKDTVVTSHQLREFLDLAESASNAFRESQQLTEQKGESRLDWEEPSSKRKYDVYNTSGYLGEIEVALYVIDILRMIPFFNEKNKIGEMPLKHILSGNLNLEHIEKTNSTDEELCSVVEEYNRYLINIQITMKRSFDFFEDYFVHFKTKNIEREIAEFKIRRKVSECFSKYTKVFCSSHTEIRDARISRPKLSLPLALEECRKYLESQKADRFAGLLEFLTNNHEIGQSVEEIVSKYQFLLQNSTTQLTRQKQNFILATIVLNCVKPKSKKIETFNKLRELLKQVLQDVGFDFGHVEPYFLASLLFWPTKYNEINEDSKFLLKCINAIKQSFRCRYGRMSRSKHPVAHFYLGKKEGLNRFVHKAKIDHFFNKVPQLNTLWQSGEIWKTDEVKKLLLRLHGRTGDDNKVYVEFGGAEKIKIPVRPVYLGKLRSGQSIEKISFYLGFSMDGPIAYDIENTN